MEKENKSNIFEIENLKCQIDGMKITLTACEERKVEQENLLQVKIILYSCLLVHVYTDYVLFCLRGNFALTALIIITNITINLVVIVTVMLSSLRLLKLF